MLLLYIFWKSFCNLQIFYRSVLLLFFWLLYLESGFIVRSLPYGS